MIWVAASRSLKLFMGVGELEAGKGLQLPDVGEICKIGRNQAEIGLSRENFLLIMETSSGSPKTLSPPYAHETIC